MPKYIVENGLAPIEKELANANRDLIKLRLEADKDPSVENDTDWVINYYQLKGWADALAWAVARIKGEPED